MLVELAAGKLLRHCFGCPEIDHVERTHRADIGHAGPGDSTEAVLGCRQHPTDQHVADFGRGEIENAGENAVIDELFHRAPANARGVEDHAIKVRLQPLDDCRNTRRRDAEHGKANGFRVFFGCFRLTDHSGYGCRRIGEHHSAQAIETGQIGHRGHHHDVGDIDEGGDVARGHRRDHDLGEPVRQSTHARRNDRGAAAAADPDNARNVVSTAQEMSKRQAHCGDGFPAIIAAENRICSIGVAGRDRRSLDIGRDRRVLRANVNSEDRRTGSGNRLSQPCEFLPLCIGCANHKNTFQLILPRPSRGIPQPFRGRVAPASGQSPLKTIPATGAAACLVCQSAQKCKSGLTRYAEAANFQTGTHTTQCR